jgi:hypothetical protein
MKFLVDSLGSRINRDCVPVFPRVYIFVISMHVVKIYIYFAQYWLAYCSIFYHRKTVADILFITKFHVMKFSEFRFLY